MKVLTWCLLLLPFTLQAQPKTDNVVRLDGISIQGSSEEPGVMYITPWREPPGTGRLFEPVQGYRQQWLQPLDAERLRREIRQAEQAKR